MASTQAKPIGEKQRLKLENCFNKKGKQAGEETKEAACSCGRVERLGRGDAIWTVKDLETIGRLPQGLLPQGRRICLVRTVNYEVLSGAVSSGENLEETTSENANSFTTLLSFHSNRNESSYFGKDIRSK
jgi:hypothetical protein